MSNVRILDVSGAQGPNCDFVKVKASGIAAVWFKASEGVDFIDGSFFSNAAKAKAAGLPYGAYHYLRVRGQKGIEGQDAARQAAQFCEAYEKAGCACDPMLDVESNENTVDGAGHPLPNPATTDEFKAAIRAFLQVVLERLHKKCIIYTSNGEWTSFGLGDMAEVATFPLWIAAVGVAAPTIPAPWHSAIAWQHTWSAQVPGIPVNVDESYWYGPSDFGQGIRLSWGVIAGITITLAAATVVYELIRKASKP